MKIKNLAVEFSGFILGSIVGRFFSEDWKVSTLGSAVGWIAAQKLNEKLDQNQETQTHEIPYHSNHVDELKKNRSNASEKSFHSK